MKQIIDRSEFSSDHPEHMRVTGRPIDDAVTEDAIRALMERHKVEELRVAALRKAAPEAHGEDLEKIVTEEPAATEKPRRTGRRFRLRYEPKWSHILLVLALAVTLARPWLIPVSVLLVLACTAIVYFTLGHDRSAELLRAGYDRLAARRPDLAARLRARGIRASAAITRLIARLPERWVGGLYLPDFEPRGDLPEKMREDPFDRLKRQLNEN